MSGTMAWPWKSNPLASDNEFCRLTVTTSPAFTLMTGPPGPVSATAVAGQAPAAYPSTDTGVVMAGEPEVVPVVAHKSTVTAEAAALPASRTAARTDFSPVARSELFRSVFNMLIP